MNCQQTRLWISDRLGGALESGWEAELEGHLEGCRSCARFAEEQARLDALLTAESMEWEPPRRVWNGIEQRLTERPEGFLEAAAKALRGLFAAPDLRPALVGLALMLALSLGLMKLPGEPDAEFLAELEAYELKVESNNPFLRHDTAWNPFFPMKVGRDQNLFEQTRNQR